MRIIAGTHRGRKLLGPEDAAVTRPITDRVKTSLFDHLAAHDLIENATVLDLFCGTGSMGLECLSRHAAHTTFIDRDRKAITRLKQNLQTLKETPKARVLPVDALSATAAQPPSPVQPYNLIFVDPPYPLLRDEQLRPRLFNQIIRLAQSAAPNATLILRTVKREKLDPVAHWQGPESKSIGTMSLHEYHLPDLPIQQPDQTAPNADQ